MLAEQQALGFLLVDGVLLRRALAECHPKGRVEHALLLAADEKRQVGHAGRREIVFEVDGLDEVLHLHLRRLRHLNLDRRGNHQRVLQVVEVQLAAVVLAAARS